MRFNFFILLVLTSLFTQAQITIDGFFEDWDNDPNAIIFDDSNYDSSGTELEEISVTNDENYLYIRVKLNEEVDLVDPDPLASIRIFLDTDNATA